MTGRVIVTADGPAPVSPPASPSEGILVHATASEFSPERVEITTGGIVTWQFADGAGGIVFDDGLAPSGGDIPTASEGTRVSRTFTAAGDYDYHSTRSRDIKGRIRVR
jgi:plastocyanin